MATGHNAQDREPPTGWGWRIARLAFVALAVITVLVRDASATDASSANRPVRSHATVPAAQPADDQRALVERYSPIIRMEPADSTCDVDTPFGPTTPDILFDMPGVALRSGGSDQTVDAPQLTDLAGKDDTYYLDLPGDPRDPGCRLGDLVQAAGPPIVTYARVVTEPGAEGLVVQYWFYYVLNDWNNNHESDWEFIQIRFNASTPADALAQSPTGTAYSQHGGGERADWDSDKLERDGEHPIVYVSQGSNANYYASRVYLGKGEPGTGFGCDDTSGHRLQFAPEVRLIPDDFESQPDWAWFTYEGRWGELLPGENKGPTGPVTKPYFEEPLSWHEKQRDVSLSFGGSSGGGVGFFCDFAAVGGNLLNSFQLNPVAVGGLVFAVAGVVSVSSAVTFRVSRRPLPFDSADPRSWERPWRLGQIVRAAFSVYRRHPLHFAGIASLALLAGGVLLSLVHSVIFSFGPLSRVLEVVDSRGFSAFLALAYGYGVNLPLILLATSAVIAGMNELREGRRITIAGAYRNVWQHLGHLLVARLRAIIVVAVLVMTIVGIPFAIRRLVRWYFLEQAIVFDRLGPREARRTSSGLVEGRWWYAAGRVALISAYGAFPGPVLSFALIMLTDLPLATIHIIGAAVYALLVPWTAIALAILYFDLKSRAGPPEPMAQQRHGEAQASC